MLTPEIKQLFEDRRRELTETALRRAEIVQELNKVVYNLGILEGEDSEELYHLVDEIYNTGDVSTYGYPSYTGKPDHNTFWLPSSTVC